MKLKTNKKAPIEFRDHAFLLDYLLDDANRIVIKKSTQIGVSFVTLLKILFKGDNNNLSLIYTLPTTGDVKDFVRTKFEPVINSSEKLKSRVEKDDLSRRAVYSTLLKRIGNSHFFFKGSWVEHSAQSIDADVLVVDELDFQKPGVREMYEERLEGSASQNIIYWMGVPSLPNYGIAELYETSDQREWWIQCPNPKCGKRQTLNFPENISFKKKTFICKHCRADLSNDDRRKGIWIPKFPQREIHGYYFNRLMAPWVPASKIINDFRKQKTRHFYNFTLGQPFLEESQQFRKDEFRNACMDSSRFQLLKSPQKICGIDQGNHFHLISGLANTEVAVVSKAKVCDNMEDLERELDLINPDMVVMDRFPDQHYAKKLQQKYGHTKFLLVNQRTWVDNKKLEKFLDYDRSQGLINLERTEALDRMYDRIRSQESGLRFLNTIPDLELLFEHFKNLVPDFQERFGRRKKVYKKTGQEDFAHASNYFLTGAEILFPELDRQKVRIVPSVTTQDYVKGTEDWIKEDFERKVMQTANQNDTIVIPLKRV